MVKIKKEQIKYKVKEATPSMTPDGIFTKDAVALLTNKKTEFSDSHLNSEPVENPNKNPPVPIYHCNDDPTLTAKMISTQSLESELEDKKSPCGPPIVWAEQVETNACRGRGRSGLVESR